MYPTSPEAWVATAGPMYSTQRPTLADLHPSWSAVSLSNVAWAKHAHSAVASHARPHSCTVSRQLRVVFHSLLPLASRQ